MALFVDLIVRIQTHIRFRIMTLVTDAAAGIIGSATEILWIAFLLQFATQTLFGQIVAGETTQFAMATLDGVAKTGRHLLEHFPPRLNPRGMDILMKRNRAMAVVAKRINILIA